MIINFFLEMDLFGNLLTIKHLQKKHSQANIYDACEHLRVDPLSVHDLSFIRPTLEWT